MNSAAQESGMRLRAGVGGSVRPKTVAAAREAAEAAGRGCPDPVLAVLFLTENHDPKVAVREVLRASGARHLVGFMAGGVLAAGEVLREGLAVLLLGGDLRVVTAVEEGLSRDPLRVGRVVGERLAEAGVATGAVLVLPDGFSGGVPEMLQGLYDCLGPDFRYVGGGAGDNLRFYRTCQFTESGVYNDAVAAAVIGGADVEVGLGHGWKPTGEPVVIGDVHGKVVLEIDGRPAAEGYAQHVGPVNRDTFAEVGMRSPLGFPDISGRYIIRDPMKLNEDGSITFVTEVPSRAVGYVMKGDAADLIRAAEEVARTVRERLQRLRFVLCFDCISRYLLMGERFGDEYRSIRNAVGDGTPLLGALSFGEIGCYSAVPVFHNKTVAILAGGERRAR